MAALRAQQNREWRERREEARKEEVASLIHLSNDNHDDDDDDADIFLTALLNQGALRPVLRRGERLRRRGSAPPRTQAKDLLSIVLWAVL